MMANDDDRIIEIRKVVQLYNWLTIVNILLINKGVTR